MPNSLDRNMPSNPPYFERLLRQLAAEDASIEAAFGRHVHWGYFDDPAQSKVTAQQYGHAAEALCLQMIELAGIADGTTVLDVGCGFGGTVSAINSRHSRVQLIGLNIAGEQLAQAADRVEPRGENLVHWLAADAARLPLADASIDLATCVEAIFHFDRPRFLAEIGRVLKPRGSLTLSDFVPEERAAQFMQGLNLGNDEAVRSAYGEIDISWPVEKYRQAADSCGLTLIATEDVSAHTLPTYAFLGDCVAAWNDRAAAERFQKATNLLEQATRRGMMTYQLLRFERR